jgi:hypothetical protein
VVDPVVEFVVEARRYCALIEGAEISGPGLFESECLNALLRLYQRLLLLPIADPVGPELPGRISHEEWQALWERNAGRIEHDRYWEVFEPLAEDKPDPVCASISDDLSDIWRDVKMGLSTFDSGKPNCVADAVWHWRFSFGSHWGRHLAGAICALTAVHAPGFLTNNSARPYRPGKPFDFGN